MTEAEVGRLPAVCKKLSDCVKEGARKSNLYTAGGRMSLSQLADDQSWMA